MTIQLKPNAEPYASFMPIPVPFHLKNKVKMGLESETRMKVTEPLRQGKIPCWHAKMLAVIKPNGDPSRVMDFQELNRATP